MTANDIINKTKDKMEAAISSLKKDMDGISTGRANPKMMDLVVVEVYGSASPLSQIASVSVSGASTLIVDVWDKGNVKAVEKAIIAANLGMTPSVDGSSIRLNTPKLSEERRKELVKLAAKYGEDKKVAARNIRRDAIDDIKKLEKEGLSKDQVKSYSDAVQKITDESTKKIDEIVQNKETELMKV